MPSARAEAITCAAKASLISTRSMSSIVIPARSSARREASTGPRPMISGERPETPVETIRASGVRPSSAALVSDMITTAAAPSLSGQQLRDRVVRHAGAGAVVRGDDGAVGRGDRGDLAFPEAVGDRLLREVLR